MSRDARKTTALTLAALLAVLLIPTTADPDLWGHTRFGLDVWHERSLPLVDQYSFTQDIAQIYHEWLGALFIAIAYTVGGAWALLALKAAIAGAALALLATSLRRLDVADAVLVLSLAVWNMVPIMFSMRPQLWTMLALLVLVRLLQDGRLAWVPVLFAVWANLHGGWVMGVGVLGVWSAATILETIWRTRRVPWREVVMPPIAVAATLLTPYGWRLWQRLGETVGLSRTDISEWLPLWETSIGIAVPILLTAALFIGLSVPRRSRPPWPWVFVCASLLYSAVRVSRLAPIAAPAVLMILVPSLAVWLPRPTRQATGRAFSALGWATVLIVLLATGVTARVATFGCVSIRGEWKPDPAAIAVLRQGIDGGRVVTYFDWGEYAYWHLGPRLRISMDGRRETIYSDRMLAIHYSIYNGSEEGSTWLSTARPEYVWLKTKHRARRDWLLAHRYRIDWESELSWVAVRDDLPRLSGALTMPSTGCFPGP
jgi:hypothetical protein